METVNKKLSESFGACSFMGTEKVVKLSWKKLRTKSSNTQSSGWRIHKNNVLAIIPSNLYIFFKQVLSKKYATYLLVMQFPRKEMG